MTRFSKPQTDKLFDAFKCASTRVIDNFQEFGGEPAALQIVDLAGERYELTATMKRIASDEPVYVDSRRPRELA